MESIGANTHSIMAHIMFYTEIMCAYVCVCVWKFCKEYFFVFLFIEEW
jgi:hypothetical protein